MSEIIVETRTGPGWCRSNLNGEHRYYVIGREFHRMHGVCHCGATHTLKWPETDIIHMHAATAKQ